MSDAPPPPPQDEGLPAWVMTFADLMSLLMCFFVLLLSFSEMDVAKFKQLAGSMEKAFGVQREIKAKEIPKGTSIIMKEFSSGRPDPSVLPVVRQHTTEDLRRNLDVPDGGKQDSGENEAQKQKDEAEAEKKKQVEIRIQEVQVEVEADATEIKQAFRKQIDDGLLEVATDKSRVIVRIHEKGSFPSGSARLMPEFEPVITEIGNVLADIEGQIIVAGHTDNIPITRGRFRSNWELSAARSATVMNYLMQAKNLKEERFVLEGHADKAPLLPNDTRENRARNRRVEVIIIKGDDIESDVIEALKQAGDAEKVSVPADPASLPPTPVSTEQ